MIRRNGVDWLVISAEKAPWGSTINTEHITHVRVQPQVRVPQEGEPPVPTGRFEVVVASTDGAQSLSYEKQDDALTEYIRISNELRGSVIDETNTGDIS